MKKIIKILKRLLSNQHGSALILVATSMVMLVGFTALVIDGGSLYLEKSMLQKSLDSAVLAGAQELLISEDKAVEVAIELASQNDVILTISDIEAGANYIQASKSSEKQLTFARVLGFESTNVAAFARAEIGGALLRREGIVPVGIEYTEEFSTDTSYPMHFQPGNGGTSVSGNFGFLQLEGTGGNDLRDSIMYGAELEVSEDMNEWTQTGLSWGNVSQGFQYRIDQDAEKSYCGNYSTADDSCSRVIIVPLIKTYEDATGKTLVKIIGFASYWLESVSQHEISGRFIDTVTFGDFGESSETDFGVNGVQLVK